MQVILSDGDMSTLANMKLNLKLNHLNIEDNDTINAVKSLNTVSLLLSVHGFFLCSWDSEITTRQPIYTNDCKKSFFCFNFLFWVSFIGVKSDLCWIMFQVRCIHLQWESAMESNLQDLDPDIM